MVTTKPRKLPAMPAETRSGGQALSARVYRSSPAPAQLEFPARRKVVKTYARKSEAARSLRQSTLTQIGYVDPVELEKFDMDSPEKRPNKRRKTMGDTPSSSFHTQTLTQMPSWTAEDYDRDLERFDDTDDEREDGDEDDPKIAASKKTEQITKKALSHVTDSRATSMIPQTPVHKKTRSDVWEVPSSQPTPGTGTPLGLTPQDTQRFRIQAIRSPLQEKTLNTNPSLPTLPTADTSTKRPRTMVIEDSYSSAPGLPSSDPIRSPLKVPRLPYITEAASTRASMELGESRRLTPGMTGVADTPAPTSTRRVLAEIELEIPDSDDDLLSLGPTPVKSNKFGSLTLTPGKALGQRAELPLRTTPLKPTGDGEREIESSDADDYDPGSPTPVARKLRSNNPRPSSQNIAAHAAPSSSSTVNHSPKDRAAVTPTPLSRNVQIGAPKAAEAEVLADTPFTSQTGPRSSHNTGGSIVRAQAMGATQNEDVTQDTPLTSQTAALRSSASRSTRSRKVQIEIHEETQDDEPVTATPFASQVSAPQTLPSPKSRRRKFQVAPPEETQDEELVTDTPPTSQRSATRGLPSQNTRSRRVQLEVPDETQDEDVTQDTPPAKSQYYTQTQGLESQRVPLEIIRAMAPQTDRSDIIISIHPEPADLIANGSKDHEFRSYKIPNTVSRIWLYVTSPTCELRYMAVIGPAKQPGEIVDDSGIGNREFNGGSGSKFAYELQEVYLLNNSVSLATMKENGWMGGSPQKYVYIKPAVVGQLLGNLRCALFDEEPQSNYKESQRIMSTPQEIEDQLRSDIIHSTQLASEGAFNNAIVLSSQAEPSQAQRTPAAKTSDNVFALPQQPASKTPASAPRLPRLPTQQQPSLPRLPPRNSYDPLRPSQATTASEPSSPVASPEKPLQRPILVSSGPSLPEHVEDESSVGFLGQHYSLPSSQLRLPDSIVADDIRLPPEFSDSDEEELDDD